MKTLELTVSVSLDGATFEDKPCMLVYNSAEGRLALIAKDYSFFASGKAAEIIPFLADERGLIATKSNHDNNKMLMKLAENSDGEISSTKSWKNIFRTKRHRKEKNTT